MQLMKLAIRNMGRSRSRSALSILAIALGVLVVILTKSLVDGMLDTIVNNTIRLTSGHVRITDIQYPKKERLLSLNYPVMGIKAGDDVFSLIQELESQDIVKVAAPRIRFGAMTSQNDNLQGVMAVGVDPRREDKVARVARFLGSGRFPTLGKKEAVVGNQLLRKLNMRVGDKITLVFSTMQGGMKAATFEVVGEFNSGLTYLDKATAYIPIDVAQTLLNMPGQATEVVVLANNERALPYLMRQVNTLLAPVSSLYKASPWYEANAFMKYLKSARAAYTIIYVFVLALASFVVANTMVMIVNERTREIGMMAALGMSPKDILHLFLLEGTLTGVIGAAIGTLSGGVIAAVLARTGILLGDMSTMDARFFMSPRIYPVFNINLLGFALAAGILVTAAVTYLPAKKAAKLEPTEALRTS